MEEDEIDSVLNDTVYDDGIYILATRRHFLSKNLEYRVAYVKYVSDLYGNNSGPIPDPVSHLIKKYFGDKTVFKSENEATTEAMRILDEVGETDHGIGVIYAWDSKTFKQISGG